MCGEKVVPGVISTLWYSWPLFPIGYLPQVCLEIEIKGSAVSSEVDNCFVCFDFRWRKREAWLWFGSIFHHLIICLQFSIFSIFFSDGAKDRSAWLGSVHDISYLRGLRSLSCPRDYQPWDNWILYQSRSATFLLSL